LDFLRCKRLAEMPCGLVRHTPPGSLRSPPSALGEGLPISHAFEHLFDMRDRRIRQDAVAKIEDERAIRKSRQHGVNFFIKCAAARAQDQWIQIALHWNARLDFLVRKIAVD